MSLWNKLTKQTLPVFVFAIGLFIVFILFGLFVPVRLTVTQLPNPWYADIRLDVSNTSVKYVSLFGLRLSARDVYGEQLQDGTIRIYSKCLRYETKRDVLIPDSTKVEYDGDGVYVGQPVDASKLHVSAVYGDLTRNVTCFRVSNDPVPLSSKVSIPVQTMYETTNVTLKTIQPKKIKAIYDADCNMGDVFDRTKVVVKLVYPDGTEFQVDNFMIPDAPKYISDKVVTTVVTDYGDAKLRIVPANAEEIKVSYDGAVYVGDVLDINRVQMMIGDMTLSGSDISMDNVGMIKTTTDVVVRSKYGAAVLKIKPITVKSCEPIVSGSAIEGEMPNITGIHVVFEDDTNVDLSPDMYELTNLHNGLKSGLSTVWFRYKTLYFSFNLFAMPIDVVNLRIMGLDIPQDVVKYDLTDKQIQNIAIVCQRLASDDLSLIAAEVSLMANRYELYGSNNGLWDYIVTSGYWGDDVQDYVKDYEADEMTMYIVRDVLMNGYRSLPLYVDIRQSISDGTVYQSGDIVMDADDMSYMFYSFPSNLTSIAYGSTSFAYHKYTGQSFLQKSSAKNDDVIMTDGVSV